MARYTISWFIILLLSITTPSVALTFKSETYRDSEATKITFKSNYGLNLFGDIGDPIEAHGYLWMPKKIQKNSKVPLIVLMPGMGGMKGRDNRMCRTMAEAGIACFGTRIYASRGYLDKNLPGRKAIMKAGLASRLADAYAALAALSNIPEIDVENAWLGGWSAGGLAARLATSVGASKPFMKSQQDFRGFLSMYAYCISPINTAHKSVPFRAFWGEADYVFDQEKCDSMINEMQGDGVKATSHLFEGNVGHWWDNMWFEESKKGWVKTISRWKSGGPDVYACEGVYDYSKNKITFTGGEIDSFGDMVTWENALDACGIKMGINAANTKATKIVDEQIIEMITGTAK